MRTLKNMMVEGIEFEVYSDYEDGVGKWYTFDNDKLDIHGSVLANDKDWAAYYFALSDPMQDYLSR